MDMILGNALLDAPSDRLLLGNFPGAAMTAALDRLSEVLADARVVTGERVGLVAPNSPQWVLGLLGLLRVGAHPVLLANDNPPSEIARLLKAAGAGRSLIVEGDGRFQLVGAAGLAHSGPSGGAVLLASSGSAGAPKLVVRPIRSLVYEGQRYLTAGLLTSTDTLLLPLPMTHAYALGWAVAALLAGARLRPLPPRAFGAACTALAEGATVLAVVPGMARLLIRRLSSRSDAPALRLVMAGAGYVDAELDAQWAARLGTGLSRNYGSTETGAVLTCPPGQPSGWVGSPLPGLRVELRDETDVPVNGAGIGEIVVQMEDGSVHRTGDLAFRNDNHQHRIIGRDRTNVVRRGARWVSTLEIETVLARAYGVADVMVSRDGPEGDDETLVADYVPADAIVTPAFLASYARANLPPYKVPNIFRPRRGLLRSPLGKAIRPPEYRLASTLTLTEALRAYRRSEVLFTLVELGALPALEQGRSAADLAGELELHGETVAEILKAAHELGLLVLGEPTGPTDVAALVTTAQAEHLVRRRLTYPRLLTVARSWAHATNRDAAAYAAEGTLSDLNHDRVARVHKISGMKPGMTSVQFGRPQPMYADPPADGTQPLEAGYDVCFVVDAIHGPDRVADLGWLARRVRPGGRVVIEDQYVDDAPDQGAALGLSWLVQGGGRWLRLTDLQAGLESVGLQLVSVTALSDPPAALVIAVQPDSTRIPK